MDSVFYALEVGFSFSFLGSKNDLFNMVCLMEINLFESIKWKSKYQVKENLIMEANITVKKLYEKNMDCHEKV